MELKPNQQLRRDLRIDAALLRWSGVDLFRFTRCLAATGDQQGAEELLRIALSYQAAEDKLTAREDEFNQERQS